MVPFTWALLSWAPLPARGSSFRVALLHLYRAFRPREPPGRGVRGLSVPAMHRATRQRPINCAAVLATAELLVLCVARPTCPVHVSHRQSGKEA